MRVRLIARVAAPMLLCAAGAVQAASIQQDDLQVIGSRTPVGAWRAAVARDISANLSAPRPTVGEPPEGVVEVRFGADARGRIDAVSVVDPSGSPALDRAAVLAIRRMRALPATPAGVDATRPIDAWVYFANTDAAADRYRAALAQTAGHGPALAGGAMPLLVGARG